MVVDISEPDEFFLILTEPASEIYGKNHKYEEFIKTLTDSISEGGGQKKGDDLTYGANKFKGSGNRAVGTTIDKDTIRVTILYLIWNKNSTNKNVDDSDINLYAKKSSELYKSLSSKTEDEIRNFVANAKRKDKFKVFEK